MGRHNFGPAATALAILAGIALVIVAFRGQASPVDARVTLSELSSSGSDTPYRPALERLRFAVAAVISPRATVRNYEALAGYLGERLDRPVELVQGRSYAEINALVRSGDVNLALVCSAPYVMGRLDFGMQLLVVPVVNGEATYQSFLIVPSKSTARSWEDLRGKTFAFSDPLSNSGRLVPIYVLYQMGERPERFFGNSIFTYSHDNSVSAVAEGLVDGAAVDSLVYQSMVREDATIAARTRVVWRSPSYGINPIVVHPKIDPSLRRRLEQIFLEMHTTSAGQQILRQLGIDRFALSEPEAYAPIEAMLKATGAR